MKAHQAAPGGGVTESVVPNVISPLSQHAVDLQTVDGLHVHEAAIGGGVSVHGTGQNSKGLNSTGLDSERQLCTATAEQYTTVPTSDSGWASTDQWWWWWCRCTATAQHNTEQY